MFRLYWTKQEKKHYENFGLGGSGKTFFDIDPEFLKELQRTSGRVQISLEKALKGVGYELYVMARRGISTQGRSLGIPWQRKKKAKRFERYWRIVQGDYGSQAAVLGKKLSENKKYEDSKKDISTGKIFGAIRPAIRYRQKGLRVEMGAVSASSSAFLKAVQGGKRGDKYKFQYRNRQPVTPKMRRLFFAMGIPLPKTKRVLYQPERPLIYPVYKKAHPHFREMIIKRMQHELDRKNRKEQK